MSDEPNTIDVSPPDRAEKLRQLRRVVQEAPEELFDMNEWTIRSSGCKTAHCAGGWAGADEWFRRNTTIGEIFRVDDAGFVTSLLTYTTYRALARVFEITDDDSEALFGRQGAIDCVSYPPDAVTKAEVIANIDRLLDGQAAEVYQAYRGGDAGPPEQPI